MKIYIGFSKPMSLNAFASLIELVEHRSYDHAYIRLPEPMDSQYLIFQASSMQVNLYSEVIFSSKHRIVKEYEIDITDQQYKKLWRFVKSMLGVPYSIKEDFGVLLMKIFHLDKQPFNDGNKAEFCSKLAATVCEILGIDLAESPDGIDPAGLDKILSKNNLPMEQFS